MFSAERAYIGDFRGKIRSDLPVPGPFHGAGAALARTGVAGCGGNRTDGLPKKEIFSKLHAFLIVYQEKLTIITLAACCGRNKLQGK
jgi:hypothetical protein